MNAKNLQEDKQATVFINKDEDLVKESLTEASGTAKFFYHLNLPSFPTKQTNKKKSEAKLQKYKFQ